MGGAKKSTWVGATIFGAVVILVATWFLGISPSLASASDLRDQADQTRQQNDVLQLQVAKLASEFKQLPDYKAQLAAIQAQMPADAQLADFLRQLDTIAAAHQVTLTAITPSAPAAVSLAAVPSQSAAADATTSTDPSPSPTASPASPAATANDSGKTATTPEGFESVSFSIEVVGTYVNTEAFVSDLQNTMPRLFLVSALTGQSLGDAPAGGGHPATQVGDQQLQITGLTYVLPDTLAAPAPASTATAPPALPAPNGRDPLVPIVKQ